MKIYDYPAVLVRVVDGDTIIVDLSTLTDIGFFTEIMATVRPRIRVARVNCPEHNAPGGAEATAFTRAWLATNAAGLRVATSHQDDYGRWVGEVYSATSNLSDELLKSQHAVPWP